MTYDSGTLTEGKPATDTAEDAGGGRYCKEDMADSVEKGGAVVAFQGDPITCSVSWLLNR